MKSGIATNGLPDEYYVVKINGEIRSGHRLYVDALKAALQLKQQFPLSDVKILDAGGQTRLPAA